MPNSFLVQKVFPVFIKLELYHCYLRPQANRKPLSFCPSSSNKCVFVGLVHHRKIFVIDLFCFVFEILGNSSYLHSQFLKCLKFYILYWELMTEIMVTLYFTLGLVKSPLISDKRRKTNNFKSM
jgi:hypothetical protein